MEEIRSIIEALIRIAEPDLVILHGSKANVAEGNVHGVSLCVICPCDNKRELLRRLYLSVESDISFDLLLYTPAEWHELTADTQSRASKILRNGTVLYER
ncbi:hypothetical protein LJC34_00540 [Oscillospiraceae bacterium OttesenSCG-928-G22]|nr:hypothetical protein [Oscillospiraceae bacterium OttesenSCG-928-G22]